MKVPALLFVLAFFALPACRADPPASFPLLGRWRCLGDDRRSTKGGGLREWDFLPDGRLRFVSESGVDASRYTFQPPDGFVILWNYGDSAPTQRVRFRQDGDVVTLRFFPMDDGADAAGPPRQVCRMRRLGPQ